MQSQKSFLSQEKPAPVSLSFNSSLMSLMSLPPTPPQEIQSTSALVRPASSLLGTDDDK